MGTFFYAIAPRWNGELTEGSDLKPELEWRRSMLVEASDRKEDGKMVRVKIRTKITMPAVSLTCMWEHAMMLSRPTTFRIFTYSATLCLGQ